MIDQISRLAVVEEQIRGLREQQKAHAVESKYMFAVLSTEIKELTAILNKGRGAFAFALMFSGTLGAVATQIIGLIVEKVR